MPFINLIFLINLFTYLLSFNPFVDGSTHTPITAAITATTATGLANISNKALPKRFQLVKVLKSTPAALNITSLKPNQKYHFLDFTQLFIYLSPLL